MSLRGRKPSGRKTVQASGNSILRYCKPTDQSPPSSSSIVKPIINELIESAVDKASAKSKKHDGNKVATKTYELWEKSFPWLEIVSTADENAEKRLRCSYCTKAKCKNVWAGEGTTNIQRSTLQRHNDSKDHTQAANRCMNVDSDSDCEDRIEEDETLKNEDIYLFRTVYTIAKSELPSESINSMLELQRLNGCNVSYQNLSWTTIDELQKCIAKSLKKVVVEEINSSKLFAIMLDESTDITVDKHLSICVRYVLKGVPVTKFLANVALSDGCAHTIVAATYESFHALGIDLSGCVSLATDGASVMLGKKMGVGVQMQAKYAPFAVQTHCFAHRLNLAITDSIKGIDSLIKLRDKFGSLYYYMSASSKRTSTLRAIQAILDEPELSIKEPHSIRWLGLKNAVYAVYMCYRSVLATLSKFASEKDSAAKGLHKYFSNYKVALFVSMMLDIHSELAILSKNLQKQNLLFSEVPVEVDSLVGKLEHMKSSDGAYLQQMKQEISIDNENADFHGEQLSYYSKEAEIQFENTKTEYIENIIRNIHKRFRKETTQHLENMAHVFEPLTVQGTEPQKCTEAVETLADFFGSERIAREINGNLTDGVHETERKIRPLLNKEGLIKESVGLLSMVKGSYASLPLSQICKRIILLHSQDYPNMAILAKIALCMVVTSVECERSFSSQNRLKHKFRSSLKIEKMDILLTILLCGPAELKNFDPRPPCRIWLAKKRRKARLAQGYIPRKCAKKM